MLLAQRSEIFLPGKGIRGTAHFVSAGVRQPVPGGSEREQAHLPQRQRGHSIRDRIAQAARVHDPEVVQLQVGERHMHGTGGPRRLRALELKTPAASPAHQEQVQFGAPLCSVEVRVALAMSGQRLFEGESLPARPQTRVDVKGVQVANAQQPEAQADTGITGEGFSCSSSSLRQDSRSDTCGIPSPKEEKEDRGRWAE